jgi:hypothetical protein
MHNKERTMLTIRDLKRLDLVFRCTSESCDCEKYDAEIDPANFAETGVPICENGLDMEIQYATLAPVHDIKAMGIQHTYGFKPKDGSMKDHAGMAAHEDLTAHGAIDDLIKEHPVYDESVCVPDFLVDEAE